MGRGPNQNYSLCRSTMVVTGVLTSGQWGYPIQDLGCSGGAEEKQPGCMRFTSRHRGSARRAPFDRHPIQFRQTIRAAFGFGGGA